MTVSVDRQRLVDTASEMVNVHSFTGDEQRMADLMAAIFDGMGLQVQRQQVEDNRANTLGTWPGAGGGPSLMFNGHMDTSYSGREPWLRGVPGFQPSAFERDGRLWLCYVEAVRALQEADVRLRGDVLIAAVSGEIEKTQQGDAQGAEYRGYAAGTRYLVSHGGVADMCLLGEPTEGKVVLGHFGALWLSGYVRPWSISWTGSDANHRRFIYVHYGTLTIADQSVTITPPFESTCASGAKETVSSAACHK